MRKFVLFVPGAVIAVALLSQAAAQPPDRKPDEGRDKGKKDFSNHPIVTRLMAFDKNKDGKLTREEVTDERLLRMFDRADTNKDGVVTKEELIALAEKLDAESGRGDDRGGPGGRGPGGRGPGGPDGPGGRGPGGPDGPGGRGPGGPDGP